MTALAALPPAVAIPIAMVALAGAALAAVGSLGLLRLRTFYARVHAPTLGSTLGLYLTVAASLGYSWFAPGAFDWRLLLIAPAVIVTAPIGLLLLVRAALARAPASPSDGSPPGS